MRKEDVLEVLISEEELKQICKDLGTRISRDYEGKKLLLVSVLKGAVVFLSDLLREITCDCRIDFMAVSSYDGVKSTGFVKFKKDLDISPEGCDILRRRVVITVGIAVIVDNILRRKQGIRFFQP